MAIATVHLLNIVCSMIPCSGAQPLPEAYIQEFTDPAIVSGYNNLVRNNSFLIQTTPVPKLDPVVDYNLNLQPDDDEFNQAERPKRLQEWNPSSRRRSGFTEIEDQRRRSRMTDRSSQLSSMIPNLLSSISIPAIPALISSLVRNVNSISGARNGRQAFVKAYDPPVVFTKSGAIEGHYMGTMKGRKISAFDGIPYAEPPVGNRRFTSPVPKSKWRGVLQAKKAGSNCIQGHPRDLFRVQGSEDCLFLNIYTPKLPSVGEENVTLLPVIFLIHGGSFQYGSGSEYGPSYLLDEDVILVTFNYRLGPLGFLSTGDSISPGNYGLKDQELALKWVHANIFSFGGNNSKITIMGQSAGAVSTHLHLISNKTTQYFQNGVSLSGSSFGFWPIVGKKRASELTIKLATVLNCPKYSSLELLKCMREASASWIIASQLQLYDWIPFHPLVLFAPVIEAKGPDAFLTRRPEDAYRLNEVMPKPWIFGQTSQEGHFDLYFIKLMMQAANIVLNGRKYLPIILDYEYFTKQPRTSEITNKILQYYGGSLGGNGIDITAISDMITDRIYTSTIRKAIKAHSKLNAPTYAYVFDYKGRYNLGSLFGAPKSEWGVSHTEDMFYYFNSSVYHHGLARSDPEYGLSQIMTDFLANFAKKGEPTHMNVENAEITFWQPVIVDNSSDQPLQYLMIQKEITMIPDPFEARVAFWDSLAIEES